MSKNTTGFTLIELIIVVAVIGVLTMIAYPSYTDQIRRTRRIDAQGALLSLAGAMERFYTVNNTYLDAGIAGADSGAPNPSLHPQRAPLDGATKLYDLQITNTGTCLTTATAYCLRAVPISSASQGNDGFIEINSQGIKGWDKNNDGVLSSGEQNWNQR